MQQSAYDDYDREWSFDPTCEIRLLRLERDITKQQHWSLAAPLNVYIKNIRTPSSNFAAISYEWGASEELAPCTIDGGEAAVRLNLLDLLKALPMLQEMRNLPKLFWIDSICINQANSEEKMHQIRLLKHVYSYAQCVLSWLSPTADFSNRAFIYVDRDVGDRSDAALVDALLNRRYWTRIWMVQEVVL
ncbi:HET-domain-containing protein, partial [Ophiobolus disseminans]